MSSKTPYKVLCVCLGNICRSPTAEIVLRHFCDEQQLNVLVDSAFFFFFRQLRIQDFVEFDLILAMDFENLSNIQSLMRRAEAELGSLRAEIALMSEHDPHYTQQELPDPYYGEADGFERVLDQCESSSRAWVKVLQQQFELKV